MRTCTVCQIEKPLDQFHLADRASGRRRGDCRDCVAIKLKARYKDSPELIREIRLSANRKLKYGVTREEVHAMLEAQDYSCAICPTTIDYFSAHVDHCHMTMKVRGLLCKQCNAGLGNFRDDPILLLGAIDYLKG